MELNVLYFAWLRAKVGVVAESVEPPATVETVGDLIEWLKQRGPGHADAFSDLTIVRAALDQEFAQMDAPLAGTREVAFFPPVTGG